MISNSLYIRKLQTKRDMKVNICFYAKLYTQNKILGSKMRHLKKQKTSVFAPLILKRWIVSRNCVSSRAGLDCKMAGVDYQILFYTIATPGYPKKVVPCLCGCCGGAVDSIISIFYFAS